MALDPHPRKQLPKFTDSLNLFFKKTRRFKRLGKGPRILVKKLEIASSLSDLEGIFYDNI